MLASPSIRRTWSAVAVVLGLACLCACQYDPYTLTYARTKPDLKDIVGSWVATEETVHDLARTPYSKARPTITVGADGAITMTDIPDDWRDPNGDGKGGLEQFVGTWQLAKHQDWWGLELRRGEWGCSGCLMICDQAAPYRLVIRVGDPDAGVGYEFRRAG